jgi:hypothetical protein
VAWTLSEGRPLSGVRLAVALAWADGAVGLGFDEGRPRIHSGSQNKAPIHHAMFSTPQAPQRVLSDDGKQDSVDECSRGSGLTTWAR